MNTFVIGQKFEDIYPPEAAVWCNSNHAYIEEIEPVDGVRCFQIVGVPEPTPEELAARALEQAKAERASAVAAIMVEVDGMVFDGDETSQERMSRTITAAVATGEDMSAPTTWVLADNTIAQVSITQLAQALRAAGEQQTALWTIPYQEETAEEPTAEPETVPDDTTTQPEQPVDTEATA